MHKSNLTQHDTKNTFRGLQKFLCILRMRVVGQLYTQLEPMSNDISKMSFF